MWPRALVSEDRRLCRKLLISSAKNPRNSSAENLDKVTNEPTIVSSLPFRVVEVRVIVVSKIEQREEMAAWRFEKQSPG